MLSKTLSFNRGIFKQTFRNVGWVGIAYLIALLFSLPLHLLMAYSRDPKHWLQHHYITSKSLFTISEPFQIMLFWTVPVILAIFLFRYIQAKLPADYMHSLPIKRASLFNQHVLYGILILVIPVIITAIVLFMSRGFFQAYELLSLANILHWVGITILLNLFIFFAGIFVAMFTGMSVLHAALTYVLLFFPAGITLLSMMNVKYYLLGFSVNYHMSQNLERLVALVRATQLVHSPLTTKEIIVYSLIIVAFYFVSLFVYQKRNIEAASQAIAFGPLRPVFKYGVAFCAMLLGGLYFGETQGNIFEWIIFGYVAGSVFGYFLAEMLLEKTWRVFNKWKGYVAFVLVMVVVGVLLQQDITGFERRVPDTKDITKVYFSDNIYQLSNDPYKHDKATPIYDDLNERFARQLFFYEDPHSIELIHNIHQSVIADQNVTFDRRKQLRVIAIGYELTNGKRLVREYTVPFDAYVQYLQPVVATEEYKLNNYPLLRINDSEGVSSIIFNSNRMAKRLVINDPQEIAELFSIFQQEMRNETSTQSLDPKEGWAYVEFTWDNIKRMDITWRKSQLEVEQWLEEKGYLEQARPTAKDYSHAIVLKKSPGEDVYQMIKGDTAEFLNNHPGTLRIENKEQLEECLRYTTWHYEGTYVIALFHNGESYPSIEMFKDSEVPQFIIDHFEK
ncbi:hypothetical protein BHU72_13575 [Desulfuribacillus stibiiarsenatis]|uniref:DUF6449 domain-containing protein n=1 Tax=Desulfuribacillus stibiiarsenatis TaxID=1390249 RepID=A0A1E5L923_9FIRM|nr:DUF6449 domain-containing protein [Desulfuribacillus stibiiarsenatis]OEH86443.1 hypothetical protein BHU72_13575 [Desulfuribacillus stibiiarsenatis]